MHQFKVSGLNSVHLICDSYFNICLKVEIGIAKLSLYYYFLFTQFFHDHNSDPYSSS